MTSMDGQMFHGMTINNILEKVDLLNFIFEEDDSGNKKPDAGQQQQQQQPKMVVKTSDPTSAYLGPKLWDNPISLDDLMDDDSGSNPLDISPGSSPMMMSGSPEPPSPDTFDIKPLIRPSIIVPVKSKKYD